MKICNICTKNNVKVWFKDLKPKKEAIYLAGKVTADV
jgi:hypothetical protein